MNNRLIIIIILLTLSLFFFSCSKAEKTVELKETTLQENQEVKLPDGFTTDKIKGALLEYINYRLWLYPAKILDNISDKSLDTYVDNSIDVEIRVYKSGLDKTVYAYTSIGEWLGIFKTNKGFVYCDGQVGEGEYGWPNDIENYAMIEKYSTTFPQPHKPNYGTSQNKDKMIALLESTIKASCEDFYKGADKNYEEWANVDVYIADFYEYENAAHAWLCRQDGSITNFPVAFEVENNEYKIQTITGFTINNKDEFNEFGRYQFERDINDAVRHFKCNIK